MTEVLLETSARMEANAAEEEATPINPDFSDNTKRSDRKCSKAHLRLVPLMVVTFCFIVSSVGNFIVLPQYILARLKSEANFSQTYNGSGLSECLVNKSDPLYIMEQEIQSLSSTIFGEISLCGGIPNVFTVLLQGVFSDRIGRKFIIIIPILGVLVSNLGLTLIIYLDLPISLYKFLSFLNGCGGQQPAFQTGAFAYIADLTRPSQRSFVLGVIEATLLLSNVGTNLMVGYLIELTGYGFPMLVLTVVPVLTILLLVCMPETLRRREEESEGGRCQQICAAFKLQLHDMRKLLLFNRRRSTYLLLLVTGYMSYELITTGAWVISTLYLLNKPFCWNSVQLGYYNAIRTTIWMVGGVVILTFFRKGVSDHNMLLLSVCSCVATYVLQGLASEVDKPFCDATMICAAVIGVMLTVGPVMMRAMCSKMVAPTEQGAMFGLMATGEAFAFAVCGAIMSAIYSLTVGFHKSFTLYLCSGLLVLLGLFFTFMRCMLPGVKRSVEEQESRAND